MRSVLISTDLLSLICSWLASRCSQRSPSQQRFPWALQLREQILKEQITDGCVFFKMPFRPCPSGCGHFLSTDDGHDRCLQCLGFQHPEDAFVDDSCACCAYEHDFAAILPFLSARIGILCSHGEWLRYAKSTSQFHCRFLLKSEMIGASR